MAWLEILRLFPLWPLASSTPPICTSTCTLMHTCTHTSRELNAHSTKCFVMPYGLNTWHPFHGSSILHVSDLLWTWPSSVNRHWMTSLTVGTDWYVGFLPVRLGGSCGLVTGLFTIGPFPLCNLFCVHFGGVFKTIKMPISGWIVGSLLGWLSYMSNSCLSAWLALWQLTGW